MHRARPRGRVTSLLMADPQPARDYAAALDKCVELQRLDGEEVNPVCRSRVLTHGLKSERALVLVHGVTNCPAQFEQLAPLFFEQGYNVLVPRIPWNGLLEQSGAAMRRLSARELRAFGDAVVDIACGLGERVTVAGLSGGGVVAAWAAQCRTDVERAVAIAPAIGTLPPLPFANVLVNRLAMRLARVLPNLMTQRFLPTPPGPPHRYDGFATRGIAAVMQLGFAVLDAARTVAPAAGSIQVVVNDNDTTVDSAVARELARRWQTTAGDRVAVYTFARDRGLIHDLIDPAQPAQQTAFVYPILVDLIAGAGVRPRGGAR